MKSNFTVNFCSAFIKLTGWPGWLLYKPKVYVQQGGTRRLPAPSILVSNHHSLLDFPLYFLVFPFRTIRFLMAEVLFRKNKAFSTLLYNLGGIRVDREGKDFGFISDAIEVLDKGRILGIFPQARLPVKGEIIPFTASTAFIALHTDAPIIPVYTDGRYGITKRTRVVIGAPLYLSEYVDQTLPEEENLDRLTKILQDKVYALKEEIPGGKEKQAV